jgi:hypothetical protein
MRAKLDAESVSALALALNIVRVKQSFLPIRGSYRPTPSLYLHRCLLRSFSGTEGATRRVEMGFEQCLPPSPYFLRARAHRRLQVIVRIA